ncbi:hypothetical protein Tco_1413646 [Tanacetum coccineum]
MVAFLSKAQGSEDFYQIVDFLNASHIRTLDNGEIELIATVDGQEKTITEASIRRHLKLVEVDGISTLPTTEIFEQLALMGVETSLFPTMLVNEQLSPGEGPTSPVGTQHIPTVIETSPQLQNLSITYRKTRNRTRRIGIRIPQSNVLSSVADEAITKEMHDGLGRATTTASSLEAEQDSGNIFKTQTKATPSGPSSSRTSLEGGPWCHVTIGVVLFRLVLKGYLTYTMNHHSEKVTALENELSNTKVVHNKALITLTKKVKKLEKKLNLKRRSAVVDSSEDEEAREAHDTTGHRMESDDTEVVDFSTASPQNDDDEVLALKYSD